MRILSITLIAIACMAFGISKKSNTMSEKNQIQETISKLFIATDTQHWNDVEEQFASKVNLDYASMTGSPASIVSPEAIVAGWKTVLPGFSFTHHQIGNFVTLVEGNKAHSFCYGTATHFLEDKDGDVWTVVGSYDFDLEKLNDQWKITAMKFNYKYQEGNSGLIQKAIEIVKSKS